MWFRHAVHGWAEADILQQLEGGRVRLRLADGANFTAAGGDVRPKNVAGLDAPVALESLEHIDVPNVLHAIRARFKAGKFYTWADHVLISTASAAPMPAQPAPACEFPPGADVPLTEKLLTRMSTRKEPQTVLVSGAGAVGAMGSESAKAAAATALCQSLARIAQGAADQGPAAAAPSLSQRIHLARIVMEAFLGVNEGGQNCVMAACTTTTFEFLEIQSEWRITDAAISASFFDRSRCMLLPAQSKSTEAAVDPCHPRRANFRVMAQLIAAARAGVDPALTCKVSSPAKSFVLANEGADLEEWHKTLSALRDLGVEEEVVTCFMHLASLVLSLASIQLPATQQHANAEEPDTNAEDLPATREAEPHLATTISGAVALALGVPDTVDGQDEVLTAILDLLVSSSSTADASLAAATDKVLGRTCLVDSAAGQKGFAVSLRGGLGSTGAQGCGGVEEAGIVPGACAINTAKKRLKALGVEIYQRLVDCVVARVNRSLRSSTLSAYAGCGGCRVIRVFEAQEPARHTEGQERSTCSGEGGGGDDVCGAHGGTKERGGSGWRRVGSTEPGSGLADLLVGVVNDYIVLRMQDLGSNLEAECAKQGVPSPTGAAAVDQGR